MLASKQGNAIENYGHLRGLSTRTKVGKYHRGGSTYEGERGVKVEGLTTVCFFYVLV